MIAVMILTEQRSKMSSRPSMSSINQNGQIKGHEVPNKFNTKIKGIK